MPAGGGDELEELRREARQVAAPAAERGGAPSWVYAAGGTAVISGFALLVLFDDGRPGFTAAALSLAAGGTLLMLGGAFVYGGGPARRNILRGMLALFSFLLIVGGIFKGVLIFAGAFSPGQNGFYGAMGVCLLAAGIPGAWYGLRYQQSREGLDIGRELGFTDASGGGADSFYDSKGTVNGVETLINVEQDPGRRNCPARFRLEILCRCANPARVRLEVRPESLLSLPVGSPPRVDAVPFWDRFEVRCDRPDEALRVLPEFGRSPGVFAEESGFVEMVLREGEFKFSFLTEGWAAADHVRRVVGAASLLSSRFN